jgi:hypothetical protein
VFTVSNPFLSNCSINLARKILLTMFRKVETKAQRGMFFIQGNRVNTYHSRLSNPGLSGARFQGLSTV